jgi:hypothetical protein
MNLRKIKIEENAYNYLFNLYIDSVQNFIQFKCHLVIHQRQLKKLCNFNGPDSLAFNRLSNNNKSTVS